MRYGRKALDGWAVCEELKEDLDVEVDRNARWTLDSWMPSNPVVYRWVKKVCPSGSKRRWALIWVVLGGLVILGMMGEAL